MPWSTVTTEYSIHCVLHHPMIDCLLLPGSHLSLSRPCCTQFSTFPQLRVNQWIESQLPLRLPPELLPPDWTPPSTPPISHDYGIQICSITASKFAQFWPQSVSPNSLNRDLGVHLKVHLMKASECITKYAWLRHPISHDYGHKVHLQTCSIMAS